jgi:hypothetical protein
VKILFDQGVPVPLRRALTGHDITTAFELGWSLLTDGQILDATQSHGFDVLVTTDKNLRFQQVLSRRGFSIVVLPTTDWRVIKTNIGPVIDALENLAPGSYVEVTFSAR